MSDHDGLNAFTYATFVERCHEACSTLVAARWESLSPAEKAARQATAFEIVFDDSVELDDFGGSDVFDTTSQPDLWWTQTQAGRRALEALFRLEVIFEQVKRPGIRGGSRRSRRAGVLGPTDR